MRGADWFATFLPERDRIRTREVFTRALSDNQTRGNVNPIVTKDGREREIEWYNKTLKRGLLPICSSCKKIRDDQGYWHQIEAYIYDHTEAE